MDGKPRGKKRRSKSFIQKAKKYGKKGKFGKGTYLNEDTYNYFLRVLEMVQRDSFESKEEKGIFVNNVFEETQGKEVSYSCNQLASRAIESLLPDANDAALERFMVALKEDLRLVCTDSFGSHVLEKLLRVVGQRAEFSDAAKESEVIAHYRGWLLKTSKYVLNNTEEFILDPYATHIIRTVLETLSGIPSAASSQNHIDEANEISSSQAGEVKKELPSEHKELIEEFADRLMAHTSFSEWPHNRLISGAIQTLLLALRKCDSDRVPKMIARILKECSGKKAEAEEDEISKSSSSILPVFENDIGARVLEASIVVASSETFNKIYSKGFINRLRNLSQHPIANHTVQKLIAHCNDKTAFEPIFDELSEHLEDILRARHTGVILCLGQACKRVAAKQGSFQQSLMKALHIFEPAERQSLIAPLTIKLQTYEQHEASEQFQVHLHGSLLVQTMLRFNKPISLVNSLLEMSTNDLKTVFTDAKGSHIIDAYMQSEYIGEKSRDKMIKKLEGMFVFFACSKHGSRSLDSIWDVSNLKQKCLIMDELSTKEAVLNSNRYGSIIANKYLLSHYIHRKNEWKDLQSKENKKKELFSSIISPVVKKR